MKKSRLYKTAEFQEGLLFLLISVFLLVYSFYKHYTGLTVEWKMSPYLFPILVALVLLVLSLSLLSKAVKLAESASCEKTEGKYFNRKAFFGTLLLAAVYFAALHFVPFFIATVVFLAALLRLFNERRWWLIGLVSLLTTLVIYFVFSLGLHVNLP